MWYVRSRLGVANAAYFGWGEGLPEEGVWWLFVSRVSEKPAEFTMSIWYEILEDLNLSDCDEAAFFTDPGLHHRCHGCLGLLGMQVPAQYGINAEINYGPGAHWKTKIDGYFAQKNLVIKHAAEREPIYDDADLVRIFKETSPWL